MKLNKQNCNFMLSWGIGSERNNVRYFRSQKSLYKFWRLLYGFNYSIYEHDKQSDTFFRVIFFGHGSELVYL